MAGPKLNIAYQFETATQSGQLATVNPNISKTRAGELNFDGAGNRERRLRYDLTTQFAEIIDGSMRTQFELEFNGHDLVGEDGTGLDEITRRSLSIGKKMAEAHPFFKFEVRRRQHEREEFKELVEMASGNGPNVMVVVSDFPAELYSQPEDVGGYNIKRKQTMLRVLVRQGNGKIKMSSQSLDRSDRKALEAIYRHFGEEPENGELLGQRIRAELPPTEAANLADNLTATYDQSLAERFGGEWYAGRQPIDQRNTYDFVVEQTDLIEHCIDMNSRGLLDNQYMYSIAATMQSRFDNRIRPDLSNTFTRKDITAIRYEVMQAGLQAQEKGLVFSGCGLTFKSGNRLSGGLNNLMNLSGFSNTVTENCSFVSKECPSCHEKDVHTTVTRRGNQRHISGSCGCHKIVEVED